MAKLQNISEKSLTIVQKYVDAVMKVSIFTDVYHQLVASLYALTPDANNNICEILSHEYIKELTLLLTQEEVSVLLNEYNSVVRYCNEVNRRSSIARKDAYSNYIPQELLDLCASLIEPEEGKTVLLPYAGACQYAFLRPELRYEGFEFSAEVWAISQIISAAYDAQTNIKIVSLSSEEYIFADRKYDYIFSCPPVFQDVKKLIANITTMLSAHMADNAEACFILPESFMFNPTWLSLRKHIITSGEYSTIVVSLPQVFSPFTGIRWCILCLKKDGEKNVMLMDATREVFFAKHKKQGVDFFELKPQTIIEALNKHDENYVWHGKTTDIDHDFSLACSKYFADIYAPTPKNGEQLMSLGELISLPATERKGLTNFVEETTDGKKVFIYPSLSIKDLSANYYNCDIAVSDVPNQPGRSLRFLSHDSLVVGYMGDKFKVGKLHFGSESNSVCLSGSVFPISVKSNDLISEEFLLRAFMLDETIKQANMYATGVSIQHIKPEDVLKIKIVVPSLDRQAELCRDDAKAYLTEADRAIIETHEEFRRDMHMKKHAIGQTIYNLNNWWKVLQKARKEGNGIVDDNACVGKAKPICIVEVYKNLENTIKKLQQQIGKFDRGNGLQVEKFALTTFIEDYIKTHQSPLFSFIYDDSLHHSSQDIPVVVFDEDEQPISVDMDNLVIQENEPIEYVTFAPDALTIIFDNIVSNACSHGFTGREVGNIIKIELLSDGDKYVVTVANNGLPINNQLSSNDVFTYGKTSQNGNNHYGIGGYEVSKLMHEFNGSAELELTPDNEFTVCYRLTFNDTNIVGSL